MNSIRAIRKLLSLLIGIPLLIVGLVLIPLPGPGLLICLLALFILAREFEWAEKHFDRVKEQTQKIIDRAKS